MATAANQTNNVVNIPNAPFSDQKSFFKKIEVLGKEEAEGRLKRPEFARYVATASAMSLIGPDDAKEVWTKFRSNNKITNVMLGGHAVANEEKSAGVRISETKKLIEASMRPNEVDFEDVLKRATPIIYDEENKKGGNTWDCYVKLARTQIKPEHADKALTNDQIRVALLPAVKTPKDKDEQDLLRPLRNQLESIINGKEEKDGKAGRPPVESEELRTALTLIDERIALLELSQKRAERAKEDAADEQRLLTLRAKRTA